MLEGAVDPNDCKMKIFGTTPKTENGERTVSCRDYLIFQAQKCTKTTFSRSFAPRDPTERAYSAPLDIFAGGEGACCLSPRTLRRVRSHLFWPQTSVLLGPASKSFHRLDPPITE